MIARRVILEIFEKFSESFSEPTILTSVDGRECRANRAARKFLGLAGAAFEQRALSDFVAGSPAKLDRYLRTCARGTQPVVGTLQWRVGEGIEDTVCYGAVLDPVTMGNPALVLLRCRPKAESIRDFHALNLQIAVLQTEVRRRQRSELALSQREAELKLTLQCAPMAIASSDLHGRLLRVNRALEELTGYAENELLAMSLRDICHHDDRGVIDEILSQAARNGFGVCQHECRIVARGAQIRYTLVHCALVHDVDDQPLKLVLQVEDRSERLDAARKLREQQEQLAHVSRINTLGEMAGGIAHEINQPLTAIAAYTQACRRMVAAGVTDSRRLIETMDKVGEQAHRAGEVIRRLRALTKKQPPSRESVHLNVLVEDTLAVAEIGTWQNERAVQRELETTLPKVRVDPVQIQQVVLNIVRNAIDATGVDSNGTDDRIVVRTGVHDPGHVAISVCDRGCGLPADAANRVFSPFFTTKKSGMGLGLSISRSIVLAHGGHMWFERNSNRGTTFYVVLPAQLTNPHFGGAKAIGPDSTSVTGGSEQR